MLKVRRTTILLYLLPMFAMLAVVSLWPIGYTLYLSFTNYTLFNSDNYKLIGGENYQKLLLGGDSDLYFVIGQTVLYVVLCVGLFLIVGMVTALALNNPRVKGQGFWRVALEDAMRAADMHASAADVAVFMAEHLGEARAIRAQESISRFAIAVLACSPTRANPRAPSALRCRSA